MIDGSTPHVKYLWLFGCSEICLPELATATRRYIISMRTASAAARTPVDCSELHQMLFFVPPLFRNFVNCYKLSSVVTFTFIQISDQNFVSLFTEQWTASKLPRLLDAASKFALFSVSGLKDEKLILKKQTYMKTETCKLYPRNSWIFLPNVIKIDLYNFELYRFKVGSFFETQCITGREHCAGAAAWQCAVKRVCYKAIWVFFTCSRVTHLHVRQWHSCTIIMNQWVSTVLVSIVSYLKFIAPHSTYRPFWRWI